MLLVCPACLSIYAEQVEFCGIDGSRLRRQAEDPLLGTSLGDYQIEARLGVGGMGCVYRAYHPALDARYAVKVLFGDKAANKEMLLRFQREARASSRIRHPSVVFTHYFGTTKAGLSYLVMELVEGPSLGRLIKEQAPLQLERTLRLAEQLAGGLAAAHREGFVHRDLKPGNIMVGREGGQEIAKILDFGVVSIIGLDTPGQLTKTGYTLGTPAYMAPEQTQRPNVGPSADLYALGTIIYEMAAGRRPFEGPIEQIMARKLALPAPPLPPCGGLERLVAKLLERQPEHRLGPAEEVVHQLGQLRAGSSPLGVNLTALNAETLEESERQDRQDRQDRKDRQEREGPELADTKVLVTTKSSVKARPRQRWGLGLGLALLLALGLALRSGPTTTQRSLERDLGAEPSAQTVGPAQTVEAAQTETPSVSAAPSAPRSRRIKRPKIKRARLKVKRAEPKKLTRPDAGLVEGPPGKLKIKADVWFDVYVDGKRRYRHPKIAQPLPPGPHTIELKNTEFECARIVREIEIRSEQTTTLEVRCHP